MGLKVEWNREPEVLELRVHGVNNTTAPALLDLRPEDVELVAGDKLGSFWRPKAAALEAIEQGGRGYVPKGVLREAYSWGGMVRTTPDVGHAGAISVVAAAAARVGYALILPFSIANVVQWTRRLPTAGDRRPHITAGLTRLFGLLLTLLFTCTTAAIALDIGAAQCAADPRMCAPMSAVFDVLAQWKPGYRFAALGLVPVGAAIALWLMAAVARLRYDVLPGMQSGQPGSGRDSTRSTYHPGPEAPPALLSHPHFWSNRATRHLALLHLSAAVMLTAGFLAAHAAFRWYGGCVGMTDGTCTAGGAGFAFYLTCAILAGVGLIAVAAVTMALPTPTLVLEEAGARPWTVWASRGTLAGAIVVFGAVEAALTLSPDAPARADRLFGSEAAPLTITTLALAIAVSGVLWRGRGDRRATAWLGCAPAVFMILALTLAVGTSAIAAVTAGDLLNGPLGASALVSEHTGDAEAAMLQVSRTYVAGGTVVLVGFVIFAIAAGLGLLLPRRDVSARARAWGAPVTTEDEMVPRGPSVLPPSPDALLERIRAKRVLAARMHAIEPVGWILAVVFAVAAASGAVWSWVTILTPDASLMSAVPDLTAPVLTVSLPALGFVGLGLVAMLASGAVRNGTRPLGIVWDIVCYLPRTGHPFGPPCYAERAVPEIAGRLFTWLHADRGRRAILAAHSMGGVLAVSALALLASSPGTRDALGRVSLLTFGVQLRPFFGRFLPELLGPEVLDTRPSLAPRLFAEDPWSADFDADGGAGAAPPPSRPTAVGGLEGQLLRGCRVPWVSLWRLTDYLGYPAMSTSPVAQAQNPVDRVAEELDLSGYMVEVGTHGEYYRVPAYERAVTQLAAG